MDTREVQPNMRECTFNVLIPGRLYTITVTTRSGKLNTSVSLEGRTGVCVCVCVCVCLINLVGTKFGPNKIKHDVLDKRHP